MLGDRSQTKQSTLMTQSDSLIAATANLRRHSSDSDAGIADRISVVARATSAPKACSRITRTTPGKGAPTNVS